MDAVDGAFGAWPRGRRATRWFWPQTRDSATQTEQPLGVGPWPIDEAVDET